MNIFITAFFSLFVSTASATPVRIGYPAAGTIVSAQIGLIFEKTDILKKNGLEGSVMSIGTGRELKTALVSGRVDVILTSQSNFVVLLGEGFPAKAVNSLGSAGRLALVVAKNSPVKDIGDLRGKKIATIFGTSLHQPAMKWAANAGGAHVVNISQVGALHAALETGAVAAALTYDPFLSELLAADKVRILREDRFDLITVAAEKFATKNPQAVSALASAFRQAVVYLRANRETVNQWFSERAKLSSTAIDQASKMNSNYSAKPEDAVVLDISIELRKKLSAEGEFLFKEKVVKKLPDIESNILAIK